MSERHNSDYDSLLDFTIEAEIAAKNSFVERHVQAFYDEHASITQRLSEVECLRILQSDGHEETKMLVGIFFNIHEAEIEQLEALSKSVAKSVAEKLHPYQVDQSMFIQN